MHLVTDQEYERWGNYFRYFYLYDEMTFTEFLESVANGKIPERKKVDWNRINGPYEGEITC